MSAELILKNIDDVAFTNYQKRIIEKSFSILEDRFKGDDNFSLDFLFEIIKGFKTASFNGYPMKVILKDYYEIIEEQYYAESVSPEGFLVSLKTSDLNTVILIVKEAGSTCFLIDIEEALKVRKISENKFEFKNDYDEFFEITISKDQYGRKLSIEEFSK